MQYTHTEPPLRGFITFLLLLFLVAVGLIGFAG
jgi:hypothetical protein